MTVVTGTFPYDVDNLLAGAARVIVNDSAVAMPAVPTKLSDVISLKSPYATTTGYVDLGATKESATYSREIESEGLEIQQVTGNILEQVTNVERTIEVSVAEMKPEHFRIFEEGAAITSIAAVSGTNQTQKQVKFGSITDLTRRRVVLIGQRSKESGVITETTGGLTRGRLVALCLYNVAIAADSAEVEFDKGSLVAMPMSFKSYPQSGQTAGQEHGFWLTEDAGLIGP